MSHPAQDPDPAPRSRGRSWLRVLLFVSLALNLAVLGVLGGAALKFARLGEDRPERLSRELGLAPYLFAMEPDRRAELRAAAGARRGEMRESRAGWARAFGDSLAVLRAEPFDAARFRDLLARQAELAAAGRGVGQDVLVGQLAAMTPEERRAFADRLETAARFGRFHPGERERGPGRGAGGPPPHAGARDD